MKIKALLIDFGGVLYDIDPSQTVSELSKIAASDSDFNKLKQYNYSTMPFMAEYEKGNITTDEFRNAMAKLLAIPPSDRIDYAWNSTLVGLKSNIDKVVNELAEQYPLYLLSNTNELHYNYFAEESDVILNKFAHCYYSYKLKMHKPDVNIFKFVLDDLALDAGNILFIDDVIDNIEAAASLGINVYHVNGTSQTVYGVSDFIHTVTSH